MTVFSRALGVHSYRIAERIWKNNLLKVPPCFTHFISGETDGCQIMLFLGILYAVQGATLLLIPMS